VQRSCWKGCRYVRTYVHIVRYGKTSIEFEFHDAASKVKVTVTTFIKCCHRSSDFISQPTLPKLYTSVRYGKTSNEFAFHDAELKVRVTVTIRYVVVLLLLLDNVCHHSSYKPITQYVEARGFVFIAISCYIIQEIFSKSKYTHEAIQDKIVYSWLDVCQ
jgi:hypothetical protein